MLPPMLPPILPILAEAAEAGVAPIRAAAAADTSAAAAAADFGVASEGSGTQQRASAAAVEQQAVGGRVGAAVGRPAADSGRERLRLDGVRRRIGDVTEERTLKFASAGGERPLRETAGRLEGDSSCQESKSPNTSERPREPGRCENCDSSGSSATDSELRPELRLFRWRLGSEPKRPPPLVAPPPP